MRFPLHHKIYVYLMYAIIILYFPEPTKPVTANKSIVTSGVEQICPLGGWLWSRELCALFSCSFSLFVLLAVSLWPPDDGMRIV